MLESNPTLAVAYTVKRWMQYLPFFCFTGKPQADKLRRPQPPLPRAYAANLSAKNIMIWLYAMAQSRAGIVHFFEISFTERNTTFRIESSVGKIAFAFVNFRTIL